MSYVTILWCQAGLALQRGGKGVQGQRTQQVPAHPALQFTQPVNCFDNPLKIYLLGHLL